MNFVARNRRCCGWQEERDRPARRIGEFVSQGQFRFDAADAARSMPRQKACEMFALSGAFWWAPQAWPRAITRENSDASSVVVQVRACQTIRREYVALGTQGSVSSGQVFVRQRPGRQNYENATGPRCWVKQEQISGPPTVFTGEALLRVFTGRETNTMRFNGGRRQQFDPSDPT